MLPGFSTHSSSSEELSESDEDSFFFFDFLLLDFDFFLRFSFYKPIKFIVRVELQNYNDLNFTFFFFSLFFFAFFAFLRFFVVSLLSESDEEPLSVFFVPNKSLNASGHTSRDGEFDHPWGTPFSPIFSLSHLRWSENSSLKALKPPPRLPPLGSKAPSEGLPRNSRNLSFSAGLPRNLAGLSNQNFC